MSLFSEPATGGNRIEWASVLGRLLVMVPIDVKHGVATQHGTADPVVADIHVLDGDDPGRYEPGVWVFPKVLKSQLEPKVSPDGSEMVIGRLIQEPTTKGSPAWKLAPATPEDNETGARWHAYRTANNLPITSVAKAAFSAPAAAAPAQLAGGWSHQAAEGASAPAAAGGTKPPF